MSDHLDIRWYHLYLFGLRLGASCIKEGNINLGFRSLCNPVRSGFSRYIEVPHTINAIQPTCGDHILDIASPKHVALFIKKSFSIHVTSTDILSDFKEPYQLYERALELNGISWEVQNARSLAYPNECFDKAYSVSVLEHIPEDGDSLAIREIGRVLKRGGLCSITVPFSSTFREIYKSTSVYERKFSGEPVFFQRIYDEEALVKRLIGPSRLQELHRQYHRSRWGIEALWDRLPRTVQMLLHWVGPLFAKLSYQKLENPKSQKNDWSGICCITLGKK